MEDLSDRTAGRHPVGSPPVQVGPTPVSQQSESVSPVIGHCSRIAAKWRICQSCDADPELTHLLSDPFRPHRLEIRQAQALMDLHTLTGCNRPLRCVKGGQNAGKKHPLLQYIIAPSDRSSSRCSAHCAMRAACARHPELLQEHRLPRECCTWRRKPDKLLSFRSFPSRAVHSDDQHERQRRVDR